MVSPSPGYSSIASHLVCTSDTTTKIDDHNNRRHAPISIDRTWATKFWPDRNFAWYLAVTEVNTALVDGHFFKGGKLIPTLQFRRKLAHEIM